MRTSTTFRRRVLRDGLYGAATGNSAVLLGYRSTRPPPGGAHFHGLHLVCYCYAPTDTRRRFGRSGATAVPRWQARRVSRRVDEVGVGGSGGCVVPAVLCIGRPR